jgi:hypothetical protein
MSDILLCVNICWRFVDSLRIFIGTASSVFFRFLAAVTEAAPIVRG